MLPWRNCKNHYFSIEDILATQEKVTCTFLKSTKLPGLESITSEETGKVEKNANVDMPFWMASVLANPSTQLAQIEMPKIYKDVHRDALTAEASCVDLYRMEKYFYSFGKLLASFNIRESKELQQLLVQTFKERFRQLLDRVQSMGADEVITDRLDLLERQLLLDGWIVQKRLDSWLNNGVGLIQPAELVINHQKRKQLLHSNLL